ncbi:C40 family peptidase [Streptosporangium sp. KLBMP 9127]|nr:C40 family peptidase [Streptosporangium sp. KLBMP 9127]
MIAEIGLAKVIAAGAALISGVALLAGMTGGAQHAAVSSDPSRLAAAVCSYVPDTVRRNAPRLDLSRAQATNAKTIIDVARSFGLPEQAAVIGVATALQESNLDEKAIGDHGTAFGLFQQHPEHGWGTRTQVTNPRFAARQFFSRLTKVKGWDRKPLTTAAQAVQRSAHPNAYTRHTDRAQKIVHVLNSPRPASTASPRKTPHRETLGLTDDKRGEMMTSIKIGASLGISRQAMITDLVASLSTGRKGSSGGSRQQAEQIVAILTTELCHDLSYLGELPGNVALDLSSASQRGAEAVRAAFTMLGTPYSWGGGGPTGPTYGIGRGAGTKGFDCSGLAEYAWFRAGSHIGTTTYEQWRAGPSVPRTQVQPGDLVFYETDPSRPGPDHVGIVASSTHMVNAPHTGAVVRLEPIQRSTYTGAVRPSK